MKTMTVLDLYNRLDDLRRETNGFRGNMAKMEVVLRVQDDDGCTSLGGLVSLDVDAGCSETEALLLDGHENAESNEELIV